MWLHGRNQELDINKYKKKKTLEKSQKLQWVLMILFLDTSPAFINMHETIWLHHQFEHKSKANDFKSRESSSCLKKVKKKINCICVKSDMKLILKQNQKSKITNHPWPSLHSLHYVICKDHSRPVQHHCAIKKQLRANIWYNPTL